MASLLAPMTRRYRLAATPFRVPTEDGVTIVGSRIGDREEALVLCHGFMGWHRKDRMVRLAESFARWFTVYAFDFRGHGRSGGTCSFGDLEILDVEAVMRRARDEGHAPVVTIGGSMGGIAVVRHAALRGGVDAAVAVSTPAGWDGHDSALVRRMWRLVDSSRGRRLARALGVRVSDTWNGPASPEQVVARVSPIPLIVVHGRDDLYFDEEQAWRLYRAAREPKRLLLADRFGHAEDGYTPAFAARVAASVYRDLGRPWPG